MGNSILAKLERIDVRYIHLVLILSLLVPLVAPLGLPFPITESTRVAYSAIERLPAGSKVLFSFDIKSETVPELVPIGVAFLTHLVSKDVKIYAATFNNEESAMLMQTQVVPKVNGLRYGENYVNLGFYAGAETSQAAFASSVQKLVKKDYYGTSVESIPMMVGITTARDFALVVLVCGSEGFPSYLRQFYAPYGLKIVCGTQAVLYPTWIQYVTSGQAAGLLNGLVGAAEYENLIKKPGFGMSSADALSMSSLLIVGFLVLGNLGYLYHRRTGVKVEKRG